MTQDEIEHMWKVASNDPNHDTNWHDPVVIAFAKLVAERALAQEKALQALHNENERLGLYKDAYAEQEPVELPCCGYTDASAVKWNPFNGVVQCHNCGQCYTTPPQRTWVGLTDEEINEWTPEIHGVIQAIEAKLKEKNA
jgi:hypothetical protein